MPKYYKRLSYLSLIIFFNIAVDQISKYIVRKNLAYQELIPIIKGRFNLIKVENSGAFLSMGDELPGFLRTIVLTGLPLMVLGFGLYYLYTKPLPKLLQIAIAFLIGGGIGNIYDRILHSSVTDFMHMDFYLFQTGVFNFADISIMIGIGILLFDTLSKSLKQKQTA
jgi:signal peptidase II